MTPQITIDRDALEKFCKRNNIRKFALFGSVLRSDFTPNSDIDVLVEFDPEKTPGLMRFVAMEREASEILDKRKVDLVTPRGLSKYMRQRVLNDAEVYFAA